MRCLPAWPVLLVALLTVACGSGDHTGHSPAPSSALSSDPAPSSPGPASGFNGTDSAWLQLMIPMAERALPLLELGASSGSRPAVRELGASLAEAHRGELDRLRALRDTAGLPDTDMHAGHDMPGMPTADRLDELRAASGKRFDRLFLESVRAHLDHSLKVTQGELRAGADPRALEAAADLEKTRAEQLRALSAVD